MDSFFFNLTDTKYKTTKLFENKDEHITRIDISNSIVFFDINLLNNEDMKFPIKKSQKSKIFILFIADFFLKRYLSFNKNEPIDFLYEKIQEDISLEQITSQPLDAFSLYIIDKIINSKQYHNMNSIRYEHNIMEFIIHRFTLLDMYDKNINEEELQIAKRAKEHLLKNFANAPTIHILAHLCATNESKLKKIFKKVYKMTIYCYIQKLRLEKANLLLKDRILNIGEIARDVGYKHQGHFSKLFFETYGIYPKDLLKD